jgi:sugar O-acyltransferase (sialic acid O-acetyltransferase NeuD family)
LVPADLIPSVVIILFEVIMIKKILLVGGGGHCLSCIEAIRTTNKFSIYGIVDEFKEVGTTIIGCRILGKDEDLNVFLKCCSSALVTVGQINNAKIRVGLFNTLLGLGYDLPVICASTSYVATSAKISQGTIIMHQAMVNANASIGINCIINTKALVEHGSTIGDHSHISTGSIVNGDCTIGKRCFIGSGAVLRQGSVIADDCIVGAGSVVISDLKLPGVYYGNPARLRK